MFAIKTVGSTVLLASVACFAFAYTNYQKHSQQCAMEVEKWAPMENNVGMLTRPENRDFYARQYARAAEACSYGPWTAGQDFRAPISITDLANSPSYRGEAKLALEKDWDNI